MSTSQIIIPTTHDNLSLGTYNTCHRKWEYHIGRGLVPVRGARSLQYGMALHEGLAMWYNTGIVLHRDHEAFPEWDVAPTREQLNAYFDKLMADAEALGPHRSTVIKALSGVASIAKLTGLEARRETAVLAALTNLPPLADYQAGDKRTADLLVATLRGYAKQYDIEPFSVLYVERNFAFLLPNGEPYSGIIDLVIRYLDKVRCGEHKTTSRLKGYDKEYILNSQFSGYIKGLKELMGNEEVPNDGHLLNAIMVPDRKELVIKPDDFMRWPTIKRTDLHIEEFLTASVNTIENIKRDFANGYFQPTGLHNGNCNAYGGCPYKSVCAAETIEERQLEIAQNYAIKRWNPLSRDKKTEEEATS